MSAERSALLEKLDEDFFLFLWNVKDSAAKLFKPLGLRPEQAFIIEMIDRGRTHPKDIAESMQLEPSLLSHYLAKLEDAGLINRELDPDDRRRTRLRLTDRGQNLLAKAREAWQLYTSRVLSTFNPEDLETLRTFLQKLIVAQEVQQ